MISDAGTIVHEIAFHTEDQFKSRDIALFPAFLPGRIRIVKALYDTVIGNGTGRMPHAVGCFDQHARVDDRILLAHLRMGVKLDPLFFGKVHPRLRRFGAVKPLYGRADLPVKSTVGHRAADTDIARSFREFIIQKIRISR